MKKLQDFKQYQWIQEETEAIDLKNWNGCYVSNLIPHRFQHFYKIIHPIYRDLNIQDETLLWSQCKPGDSVHFQYGERLTLKELAKKYQLPYTKEITSANISHVLGGSPRYLILGEEGSMDKETLHEFVSVIKPFTKRPCYFQYHLLKINNYKENHGNGHMYQGELEDVFKLYEMGELIEFGSPSYWWGEDKSWCLYTDYDFDFSVVGGSKEVIDALLGNNELECIEVDLHTRLDSRRL